MASLLNDSRFFETLTREKARSTVTVGGKERSLLWYAIDRGYSEEKCIVLFHAYGANEPILSASEIIALLRKKRLRAGRLLPLVWPNPTDLEILYTVSGISKETFYFLIAMRSGVIASPSTLAEWIAEDRTMPRLVEEWLVSRHPSIVAFFVAGLYPTHRDYIRIPPDNMEEPISFFVDYLDVSIAEIVEYYDVNTRLVDLEKIARETGRVKNILAVARRGAKITLSVLRSAVVNGVSLEEFHELERLREGGTSQKEKRELAEDMTTAWRADPAVFDYLMPSPSLKDAFFVLDAENELNEGIFERFARLGTLDTTKKPTRVYQALKAIRNGEDFDPQLKTFSNSGLLWRAFLEEPEMLRRLHERGIPEECYSPNSNTRVFYFAMEECKKEDRPERKQRLHESLLYLSGIVNAANCDYYMYVAISYKLEDVCVSLISRPDTQTVFKDSVDLVWHAVSFDFSFALVSALCALCPVTLAKHPVFLATATENVDRALVNLLLTKKPVPSIDEIWEQASNSGRAYLSEKMGAARALHLGRVMGRAPLKQEDPGRILDLVSRFLGPTEEVRPMIRDA